MRTCPKLTQREIVTSNPIIKLRFEGGDTASMTFIHHTPSINVGEYWDVVIHSSYGTWEYGWSYQGMGNQTIYEFMLSKSLRGYFEDKFTIPEHSVFNLEKTQARMRARLKEEYPVYWSNREAVDQLRQQIHECNAENIDQYMDYLYYEECKPLRELLGDDPHDLCTYAVMCIKDSTAFFFKKMYPKFLPMIRKLAKEYKREKVLKTHKTDRDTSVVRSNRVLENGTIPSASVAR